MDLSIIVVSYNTRDLLRDCLRSVTASFMPSASSPEAAAHLTYEIIVVDNASADGSATMVAAEFPQVCLITNQENRGFAAANNQAIPLTTGNYVLFLNPDTRIVDDAIVTLWRYLEEHPEVGAVCGSLLNPDGSFQHSAFSFPNLWMGFFEFFPLNHRLLDSRLNGRYPKSWYHQPFPVDFPLGACFLVRRAALEQVGLFDEGFFLYYEEVDWFLRLRRVGWPVYCVPQARIVHYGGQSTQQRRQVTFAELHKAKFRFYRKHYSALFHLAACLILRLGVRGAWLGAWWERRRGRLSQADYEAWCATYLELLKV